MKELDVLLEHYVRSQLAMASPQQRRIFARLLDLPDPELADYIFGHSSPREPELAKLARLIGSVRGCAAPPGSVDTAGAEGAGQNDPAVVPSRIG